MYSFIEASFIIITTSSALLFYFFHKRSQKKYLRETLILAHEVKNPLSVIIASIHALLNAQDIPESHKKKLGGMLLSSEYIAQITSCFQNPNHLDLVHDYATSLHTVIKEVCGLLTPLAEARNIRIQLMTPASSDVSCSIPPLYLKQILFNLLHNALKFCNPNSAVRLAFSTEREGAKILISDFGPGLSPTITPTGLGLKIAQSLIEKAQGKIRFSNHTAGLTVEIIIPLASLATPVKTSFSGKQVLLVKESTTSTPLQEALRSLGVVINEVHAIQDALRALGQKQFDIVCFDEELGLSDGCALAKLIKEDLASPKTRFLFASHAQLDLKEASHFGVDGCLKKSSTKQDLIELQ